MKMSKPDKKPNIYAQAALTAVKGVLVAAAVGYGAALVAGFGVATIAAITVFSGFAATQAIRDPRAKSALVYAAATIMTFIPTAEIMSKLPTPVNPDNSPKIDIMASAPKTTFQKVACLFNKKAPPAVAEQAPKAAAPRFAAKITQG